MSSDIQASNRSNAWSGWLIVSIIVLPMLAAWLIFTTGVGIPEATVNRGDLLQPPISLAELALKDEKGTPVAVPGERKIWRMVMVGNGECSRDCRDLMYKARQVHVRLGDKAGRVERLYLNTEDSYRADFKALLDAEYPHLLRAHVNAGQWQTLIQGSSVADRSLLGTRLYLIDQQGYAMMSYGNQHQGGDLLDDIKRLLKYSYEE